MVKFFFQDIESNERVVCFVVHIIKSFAVTFICFNWRSKGNWCMEPCQNIYPRSAAQLGSAARNPKHFSFAWRSSIFTLMLFTFHWFSLNTIFRLRRSSASMTYSLLITVPMFFKTNSEYIRLLNKVYQIQLKWLYESINVKIEELYFSLIFHFWSGLSLTNHPELFGNCVHFGPLLRQPPGLELSE